MTQLPTSTEEEIFLFLKNEFLKKSDPFGACKMPDGVDAVLKSLAALHQCIRDMLRTRDLISGNGKDYDRRKKRLRIITCLLKKEPYADTLSEKDRNDVVKAGKCKDSTEKVIKLTEERLAKLHVHKKMLTDQLEVALPAVGSALQSKEVGSLSDPNHRFMDDIVRVVIGQAWDMRESIYELEQLRILEWSRRYTIDL